MLFAVRPPFHVHAQDAESEQKSMGDASELHVIIFDEIDALCKKRGSTRDGTGVHDSLVNQLLSKIDGVEALNNILIIGMTNRKDLLDDALLRPGRLEVHIEIGLPDEHGHAQILSIHTAEMKRHGRLSAAVSIESLAARTKNFTGAELECLVKSAASYAFNRAIDPTTLTVRDASSMCVDAADFDRALLQAKPAFGVEYVRGGIIRYSPQVRSTEDNLSAHTTAQRAA